MREIWKPPFSDDTREVVVPEYNGDATLAQLEAFMDGSCFSSTVPYDGLKAHILEKKRGDRSKETYQVNVVRTGKGMSETPLGNLWWLTVARLYELCSATVHVNSFYTAKPPERSSDIEEITERLRLKKAFIHRAEDFGWHAGIFTHLSEFITANRADFIALLTEARDNPTSERPMLKDAGLRGSMEGIQSVIEGNTENARTQLFRLVEELHVFMNEYNDDNAHLLLNHERFTPALLRVLYGDKIRKQLVHIALPDDLNEFRGGNGTVGQLFDRAVRRPSNDGEERSQKFARGIVDMLKTNLNNLRAPERESASFLGAFDKKLSEWAFSEMSSKTLSAVMEADGFEHNADAICTLLDQCVGSYGEAANVLLEPMKTLITKIRGNPVLVAETYAAFLETKLIESNTHAYYYYIVNALLKSILAVNTDDVTDKHAFNAAIDKARQLIEVNLDALTRSIWQCKMIFSLNTDVSVVEGTLTRFMGRDVTLLHTAEHHPFLVGAIRAVGTKQFAYSSLHTLREAIVEHGSMKDPELKSVMMPELLKLKALMMRSIDTVRRNIDEDYKQCLRLIFDEDWCDALEAAVDEIENDDDEDPQARWD